MAGFSSLAKAQRLFGYITHMKIPQKGSIKCLIISYSFSILHIGHSSAMFLQRLVLSALFLPLSVLYITVGVKNGKVNVSIQDYSTDYDVEMEMSECDLFEIWTEEPTVGISTIVFRPVDCVIPKLEVYGFDSNGKKDGVIESFSDLTPEDAVCFRLERAECIPQYKIRWYSEYGEYAEHVFSDNLRNGINTVDGIEYRINFVSVLRRALDLR